MTERGAIVAMLTSVGRLNPDMQKALFRLGTSHAALGDHAEAVQVCVCVCVCVCVRRAITHGSIKAFERVLRLDGGNLEARRALEHCRSELRKADTKVGRARCGVLVAVVLIVWRCRARR